MTGVTLCAILLLLFAVVFWCYLMFTYYTTLYSYSFSHFPVSLNFSLCFYINNNFVLIHSLPWPAMGH